MSDVQTQVTQVVATAKTEVETKAKSVRQKIVAYFASHVVATAIGSSVLGAIVGHFV